MPTAAEKIVSSPKTPNSLKEAIDDVRAHCEEAYNALNEAAPHDPIHTVHENHGLHAYRYEKLDDGSVVALFANTPDADVKMKAFANMEEASRWTPREERDSADLNS